MDQNPRRERWTAGDLALAVTAMIFLILAIPGVVPQNHDPVMGTYTETGCTPRPSGRCRSHGTWTSHDGTITRTIDWFTDDIGPDGTARASWDPDGAVSSSRKGRSGAWWLGVTGPTGPLLMAAACVLGLVWRQRGSRRRRRP